MKRVLSIIFCICMLFAVLSLAVFAKDGELIEKIELILPEPRVGEKPCTLEDVVVLTEGVKATEVSWFGDFDQKGLFAHGGKYGVEVHVYPTEQEMKISHSDKADIRVNNHGSVISRIAEDNSHAFVYHYFVVQEAGKLPEDENLSVNSFEWEVLRLVNVERAKEGLEALSMLPELQELCDIREHELAELYSHTRPNETNYYTVFGTVNNFNPRGNAENLQKGAMTPAQVVNSWMNSPGHRANILREEMKYIGIGYYRYYNEENQWCDYWVQLFATRDTAIADVSFSTDKRDFVIMEDAAAEGYITIKDKAGYTSYMPMDPESMKESGKGYTPRIDAKNLPTFTYKRSANQLALDIEAKWNDELAKKEVTNDFTQDDVMALLKTAEKVEPNTTCKITLNKHKQISATTTREGYIAITATIEKYRVKRTVLFQKQYDRLPRVIDVDGSQGSLFNRYIPVAQVYSALPWSYVGNGVDSTVHIDLGTRYYNEINPTAFNANFKRSDYQGHFLKVNYLGTYGTVGKAIAFDQLGMVVEDKYDAILKGEMGTSMFPFLSKDTIVVSVDMYDADKNFVRTVSPACIILAINAEGEFLTYSRNSSRDASLFFSLQNTIFAESDDARTGKKRTYIDVVDAYVTNKATVESLLTITEDNIDQYDAYKFTQYKELVGEKRYDTNIIIDDDEFITPDGTYYQIGLADDGIEPAVINKVENVVSHAAYPHIISPGYTQRLLLTEDGTLYGVSTKFEFATIAINVKKMTQDYYLTNDGILYQFDGNIAATDVVDFDEYYDRTVYGVLKSDGSFYLGYTYLAGGDGYAAGLQKMLDNGAMVVSCGVMDKNHVFYRWESTLISAAYDEHAFANGQFIQKYVHKLSLVKICTDPVRIFPHEFLSKVSDNDINNNDTVTGFVVDKKGTLYGFGLHHLQNFGEIGIVERIFPMYSSSNNGNFVGIKVEGEPNPYGIVARYCDKNIYRISRVGFMTVNELGAPVMKYPEYMCETNVGFRGTDGIVYVYDNDPSYTSDRAFEPVKVSSLGQMRREEGLFCAYNMLEDVSLPLLPSVATWSFADRRVCLIERTDGSMWMVAIHPRETAASVVARIGGYQNSNVVQITEATSKRPATDYTLPVFVAHTNVKLTLGSLTAYVNGQAVTLDAPPINRNNRTLLPVRFLANSFGVANKDIVWIAEMKQARLFGDGVTIVINIGQPYMTVNGRKVELDSPAIIENGRTYLPVRAIANALGVANEHISWDAATSTATLLK